mmetsp:Transcript_1454/g.3189  ORF Transcript_1454/g.3189 Transcript_1454/m.3189 type:complete len:273 (+) Transcript_1454:127-945(+)
MAASCEMIAMEPFTAEYKSIRAADRARCLKKKRATYELTQSLAEQRDSSTAIAGHPGAHGHRAARVMARTCLAKGLMQTSSDMPSLSLGHRRAGPTGCKSKTTVANLINFQSEWHNTDVNNVEITTADLSVLMNKGIQDWQDWIDADATTTEGSDGSQSDRLDSVASTPFATPLLAPAEDEPCCEDHDDELTPLPAQALDTDASPGAAVDKSATCQDIQKRQAFAADVHECSEDEEDDIQSEPDAECSGGWELVSTHKEVASGAEGEWHVIG